MIKTPVPLVIMVCHDDAMTWKRFPYNWPFVKGIHQSLLYSPHKGSVMQSFNIFFVLILNMILNKNVTTPVI